MTINYEKMKEIAGEAGIKLDDGECREILTSLGRTEKYIHDVLFNPKQPMEMNFAHIMTAPFHIFAYLRKQLGPDLDPKIQTELERMHFFFVEQAGKKLEERKPFRSGRDNGVAVDPFIKH